MQRPKARRAINVGQAPARSGGRYASARTRRKRRGASVLCVEDNDDTRLLLFEILSAEGCDVTTAASMREGLVALECGEFDLVLTDYSLPDCTGVSMLQLASAQGFLDASPSLVLFTGESELPPSIDGVSLVHKPLLDELVRTVHHLLHRAPPPAPSRVRLRTSH